MLRKLGKFATSLKPNIPYLQFYEITICYEFYFVGVMSK